MADKLQTVGLDEVRAIELAEIETRRKRSGLPLDDLPHEILGLSLSGGGLRSASFALGFVQALHRSGLWRWIDYLSTVSGGSYLGGYLSSASLQSEHPFSKDDFPLKDGTNQQQPRGVMRFIYGGKYLFKPWELFNKYLIGLFFINVALFSGLLTCCAFIALLWRCFDLPLVRNRLALLDLDNDLLAPFWPFFGFLAAWLVAWVLSYYRRGATAPGRLARILLYGTAASFLFGGAILIGNGDVDLAYFSSDPAKAKLPVPNGLWAALVGIVTGGLLPFLRPKRLIQSGIAPKHVWERYVFGIATTALLVGLPLLLIALLAQENISGYSDHAFRPMIKEDIDDWAALGELLDGRTAAVGPQTVDSDKSSDWSKRFEEFLSKQGSFSSALEIDKLSKLLQQRSKDEITLRHSDHWQVSSLGHYVKRLYLLLGAAFGAENQLSNYYDLIHNQIEPREERVVQALNARLETPELLKHLMVRDPDILKALQQKNSRLAQTFREAEVMDPVTLEDLPAPYRRELNRALLEAMFPNIFRDRTQIRRRVVIENDQLTRLVWFGGSLFVFLCAGLWINVNATSMHGYYRSRLAEAFVVPKGAKDKSVALSEMKTCDRASPYHLISATISWFHKNPNCIAAENSSTDKSGQWTDQRSVDSFLLSNRFCGSQVTGYLSTKEYETSMPGDLSRMDLADAIALSGGAVSPGHVQNRLIAFLMFSLNLRLGQWLPTPGCPPPRWSPTVLQLLGALRYPPERRTYCFVSDGGNSENLGLVQLFRRRCRLIIAVDCSCDPDQQFHDLARAVRLARIHGGVRLVDLPSDGDEIDRDFQTSSLVGQPADKTERYAQRHFLLAKIKYLDDSEGLLVYVKPSFDGDESLDLKQYRALHADFPHEPTSDQLFREDQVESYRNLGFHIGMKLCEDLRDAAEPEDLWTASKSRVSDLCKSFIAAARAPHAVRPNRTADFNVRDRFASNGRRISPQEKASLACSDAATEMIMLTSLGIRPHLSP